VPSLVEHVDYPVHELAVCAMGVVLMDSLNPDYLARACAQERRWEFLLSVAPLVLSHGTGTPVELGGELVQRQAGCRTADQGQDAQRAVRSSTWLTFAAVTAHAPASSDARCTEWEHVHRAGPVRALV
jgi:hypothetical protein